MKIRNGFVSNSSSSSFVILGKKVNLQKAIELVEQKKDVYIRGKWMEEGQDIFLATSQILDCIAENQEGIQSKFSFYETYESIMDDVAMEIDPAIFPGKFFAYPFTISHHSTEDLDTFKDNYLQ